MWGPFCDDYIPKVHELKILPEYFWQVWHGNKTFELRKNDRNYNAGDKVILKEFKDGRFTGCQLEKTITYVLKGGQYGLESGYVILAIK
nr:ASCH/PUA domain-containing protein [Clostridium neonatale]